MKILTAWLRAYLPSLPVSDRDLADDLTLRGIAVEGVHPLGRDLGHLFEMDITTNRVDAMNHFGIAREAATIYDLGLPPLDATLPPAVPAANPYPVRIEADAQELCGRFTARVLRDVSVAPSSGQVSAFFDLLGQKQISNAVDASNFTLLGMGHPTHAFDLDKLVGGIVVRLARPGEKLRLLDGTERTLEPDDLVIADEQRALSLAGVMGGFDSMITPETRNILVESAWFDPATIRRSSRRHLLHTDASHRFERGADFNAPPLANHLVTRFILGASAHTGAHIEGDLIDLVDPATAKRTADRPPVKLSIQEVQRHLGATLDDTPDHSALTPHLVQQYLTALGCTLTASGPPKVFEVYLPSWRLDLERDIDLIEEVARVYGYNRFANTLPAPCPVVVHPAAAPEHAIRTRLLALGFSETISSTFASAPGSHLFSPAPDNPAHVALENPLSEDACNLRPSLLPGMLSMLAHNLNRDVTTVRLFEQGDTFHVSGNPQDRELTEVPEAPRPSLSSPSIAAVFETPSLALGLTSANPTPTPLHSASDAPIFELKGVIESIASLFTLPGGAEALAFTTQSTPPWLHPGRSATALLGRTPLAHFGELSPAESARRKLRQPVFLAEIHLAQLLLRPLRKVTAHELSRFQAAERDFSFLFPDSVHWHTVASAIHALSIPELQSLNPVEIFRDPKGKAVSAGHHSLLLRAVFQSPNRTLTDDELSRASSRIIEALTQLCGTHRA